MWNFTAGFKTIGHHKEKITHSGACNFNSRREDTKKKQNCLEILPLEILLLHRKYDQKFMPLRQLSQTPPACLENLQCGQRLSMVNIKFSEHTRNSTIDTAVIKK